MTSLADSIFASAMRTFKMYGGAHARCEIATCYDLAKQDLGLKRLTREQFNQKLTAILEARDRLEAEIAKVEGPTPLGVFPSPVATTAK
jgi:hypothetical protein